MISVPGMGCFVSTLDLLVDSASVTSHDCHVSKYIVIFQNNELEGQRSVQIFNYSVVIANCSTHLGSNCLLSLVSLLQNFIYKLYRPYIIYSVTVLRQTFKHK